MRPKPSLDGVQAKIERAQEHFKALNGEVRVFLGDKSYEGFVEFDSESRWRTQRVRVLKTPPSMRWGVIVGEIAHHLRSALDHLVWELVRLNEHIPGTHNEFPIATDPEWYAKRGTGKLKGIAGGDRAIIEQAQPYHRGNAASEHPLALLDWLAQVDKHRFVHATWPHLGSSVHPAMLIGATSFPPPPGGLETELPNGPLIDGAVVARHRIPEGFGPEDMDLNFHIPIDVGLDEGRSLGNIVGQAGPYISDLVQRFYGRFMA